MSKRYLWFLGVAVAVGIAILAFAKRDDAQIPANNVGPEALAATEGDAYLPNDAPDDKAAWGTTQRSSGSVNPFAHLPASRKNLPLDPDPFAPESQAEQAWLDRNGYPNAEQWVAYSSASDALLEQAAAAGDQIAAVVLDSRKLMRGDEDAPDRLFSAATSGSAFALSLLSAYMAGSPNGDPVLAYSISRVMEMKGDTRVALAREAMFPRPLGPEERIRAEADALRLFEDLKSRASRRPVVDPRPFRANNKDES